MYHVEKIFAWPNAIEFAEIDPNIVLDTTDVTHHDGVAEKTVGRIGVDRVVWGCNLPVSYPGLKLKWVEISRITAEEKFRILRQAP
jgi:predicted TIM-barrel fold metal-dependent hydrolase